VELAAGGDLQLLEHLREVVLDGSGTDEQAGADLGVGEPLSRQPGDAGLLGRELPGNLRCSVAHCLSGGQQLPTSPFGEARHSHGAEHLVRGPELLAGIRAGVLAAQPLAVQQAGTGVVGPDARAAQELDSRTVVRVGFLPVSRQGMRTRFEAQRPVRAGRSGDVGDLTISSEASLPRFEASAAWARTRSARARSTSAARLYWEGGQAAARAAGQPRPEMQLPAGVTVFASEIFRAPRSWTEKAYHNLIYFHQAGEGGHLAAWEQPQLFSEELRAAFRTLR